MEEDDRWVCTPEGYERVKELTGRTDLTNMQALCILVAYELMTKEEKTQGWYNSKVQEILSK